MTNLNGLKPKRILLVEDIELNQYLARHIIEGWGYEVVIVDNGRKAVDKVLTEEFDLVLMDIQMPEMDGMEATKTIRKMTDKKKSSVPIVALTANALKSECETYISIGMNDWLAKPFEEKALFETVKRNIKLDSTMNTSAETGEVKKNESVAAEGSKLYDLSMVEAISGGDRSFIDKMMKLFLETVPATLKDLKDAADKAEWMALSKHAHKLKSTIDSMGIEGLKEDIRAVESGGKTGDNPQALLQLVNKVSDGMKRVMEQVKVDFP